MFIVKAKGIGFSVQGAPLFSGVDLELKEGEHAALLGRKGAGKTTLLGILQGAIEPEEGQVQRFVSPEEWGWLQQAAEAPPGQRTIDYVRAGTPRMNEARCELLRRQEELEKLSGQAGGGDAAVDWEDALARYGSAYERYAASDGYGWEAEVERAMKQAGLEARLWELPYDQLSGGQQTKAGLARLLARKPKVLLLDEPTNHVDEETMLWLQEWVRSYPGTILMVSHDRAFLDATAERILELQPQGVRSYNGNYRAYREQKELERKTQEMLYRKQEAEKEKLLESIRMYQQWYLKASRQAAKAEVGAAKPYYAARANKHTARYHAKQKELERLESNKVEQPRDSEQLRMRLESAAFEAKTLIHVDRIRFAYEHSLPPLFSGATLTVKRGDRVAVVGPNGAGKSTLLKLIIGELTPREGTVTRHPELKIGYFSQQLQSLRQSTTILDSLLTIPGMTESFARTILGCFLFSRDSVYKEIGSLSMGEKCRVAFLQLYFSGANLLVLDEPTNYLDIDTRERMEEALAAYNGAFVVVSHDRYLLRALASKVVALDGRGGWRLYEGSFAEYEERLSGGKAEMQPTGDTERIRILKLRQAVLIAKEQLSEEEKAQLEQVNRLLGEAAN
ncbi:ribosomal protection-like ABC-F family protein [Paenibacillus thermotolerans]|uniref:ribosomal protection-like ABC-F family protein n=1 Tax=Paenibacillus thermotolerans TaxID=3027807 RepID=UPI0023681178|nr:MULTISPECIES: ABC-F type ribosomal protection protein [unclassified Paenibacillus]